MYSNVVGTDDKLATWVFQIPHRQAGTLEEVDGPLEEGALGNGDAQRAHRYRRGLTFEGGLHGIEGEGKAGSRTGAAETLEHLVVAAAAPKTYAELGQVGLYHHARVIAKRAHDGEVHAHAAPDARLLRATQQLGELVEPAVGTAAGVEQPAGRLDGLATAVNARQLLERAAQRGRQGEAGGVDLGSQADQVAAVAQRAHTLAPSLVHARGVEQGVDGTHRPEGYHIARKPGRLKGPCHKQQDLCIGVEPARADQLDAELRELAGLAAQGVALAEDGRGVAQAERSLLVAQARGDHARDRQRHLRAQHEQIAVGIEQAERILVGGVGRGKEVGLLEHGGLDRQVAGLGKAAAHGLDDLLAPQGLLGEDVSEAAWGGSEHNALLALDVR